MAGRALIIAVEDYPATQEVAPKLSRTIERATRFADFVVKELGVRREDVVMCRSNATPGDDWGTTREQIVAAVERLAQVGRDETEFLIVYVAGHGARQSGEPGDAEKDLLLLSDFVDERTPRGCVDLNELSRMLAKGLGNGKHLWLIDMCRRDDFRLRVDRLPAEIKGSSVDGRALAYQLFSTRALSEAWNDDLFFEGVLLGLAGDATPASDDDEAHRGSVTFAALTETVNAELAKDHRAAEAYTSDGRINDFDIRPKLWTGDLPAVRNYQGRKIPPIKFLVAYDEIAFLGATNGQLAAMLEQAFRKRGRKRWKKLEIFSLEDVNESGRLNVSQADLEAERNAAEANFRRMAAEIADRLTIYRYRYAGYFASLWTDSVGRRLAHVSPRVSEIDTQYAPATDYVDYPQQRHPTIEKCFDDLKFIRERSREQMLFDGGANAAPGEVVDKIPIGAVTAVPASATPRAAAVETPAIAASSPVAARALRAFSGTTVDDVFYARRAVIGSRLRPMTEQAERARRLLIADKTPNPAEFAALETAIRIQRPAPVCRRDEDTPLPRRGNWLEEQWKPFQRLLRERQQAVARLDLLDEPEFPNGGSPVGTGFLVAPDALLTAAHVAELFLDPLGRLIRGRGIADFYAYAGGSGGNRATLEELIAVDRKLDLALLRIGPLREPPPVVLAFSERPSEVARPVCVVGYPLNDSREVMRLVMSNFADGFCTKRAAVGEITAVNPDFLLHDCSTLGGNSGSPVLDLADGAVCAVHTGGKSLTDNDCVPATVVRQFLSHLPRSPIDPSPSRRSMKKKANYQSAVDDYLRRLKEHDPDIVREMDQTRENNLRNEAAYGRQLTRETIVLLQGRPVLDVRNGAAVLDMPDVDNKLWRERLGNATGLLAPNISAVGRIELANHPNGWPWLGTGWMIRDDVVVTNRHVAEAFGELQGARFVFKPGFESGPIAASIDFLEEFGSDGSSEFPLFDIVHIEPSSGYDIAFLRVQPANGAAVPKPIVVSTDAPQDGDFVAVIGYPARDPYFPQPDEMDRIFNNRYDKKRLAPGLLTGVSSERLYHDCTTLGGCSGGEVVSLKTGRAVALHFAGVVFQRNHAVPIAVVDETLRRVLNGGPRPVPGGNNGDERRPPNPAPAAPPQMPSRTAEITVPVTIRVEIGAAAIEPPSAAAGPAPTPVAPAPPAPVDVGDDDLIEIQELRPEDYHNREGYDPKFLGDGFKVPLPKLTENQDDVLKFQYDGATQSVLDYTHFSVVMSKSRRMCFFSACNIDGKRSKKKARTAWLYDARIPKDAQIMKECYGNLPKFSRGHMTRREDPVWGRDEVAARGNSDSMHVTNTVPQMQPFNAGIWLQLEDYALKNAREDDMKICVFTGPFLEKNDPFRFNVKVPVSFWKVIAFIHDDTGKLCATGYTMSQKAFLREEEFVFGQHESRQRPIAEIERRAGISFGPLADLDPLRAEEESAFSEPLKRERQIRFI